MRPIDYAHIRKITLREGPSAPVAGQIPGWALCVVVGRIAEKAK